MAGKKILVRSFICFLMLHAVSAAPAEEQKITTGSTTSKLEPITSLKCNQFTFDATGSYDPDSENITFFWDLGDGSTSTEAVVTHSYEKAGDYKVTLTATDNSGLQCSTSVLTQAIRVNLRPHAAFTAPEAICTDQQISLDASESRSISGRKLNYEWDFGDGTKAVGQNRVTKTYAAGGNYKISLKVEDGGSDICSNETVEKTIHVNEPPVAVLNEETILKCVGENDDLTIQLDASQSSDVNNDPMTFLWDFGDGSKGEGAHVSHRYTQTGNYDVKLIVKDDTDLGCGTSVDFVTVRLNEAPKADAGPDTMVCPGDLVEFDGTNSFEGTKGTSSFAWSFGDGESATGAKVSHIYSKSGKYQASLTLENKLNPACRPSVDTATIVVNSQPTVSIKSETAVCLGSEIKFTASASDGDGDGLEYYWSFGDGAVQKAGPQVSHIYKQGGTYKVSVIVDDAKKTSCSTATAEANVKVNTPPTADAGPNLTCCVGAAADFNASTSTDLDGDPLTYTWDFGDGTKAKGVIVNHAYPKSGSYHVTVTVDDNSGTPCSKSTASFTAQVNSGPVPVMNIR